MNTRFGVCVLLLAVVLSGCARVASDGKPAAAVDTKVSSGTVAAAEPSVIRDASGSIFVLYVEHIDKDADVFVQKADAAGKLIGEKVRVDPQPGEAKAWRGDPPTVAFAPDGTMLVGWTRKSGHDGSKTDLMLSASHDGGRTFDAPVKVNDDELPASHGMHSLAVDANGRIYLAWLDERNIKVQPHVMDMSGGEMHHEAAEPNSEIFFAMSDDGGRSFTPNKRLAKDVCPCCKTSLLAASDGTIYLGWRQVLAGDHRHIAVAHSSDGGATFSDGVIVSDDNWQIDACPVSGAALASPDAHTLDVVWYTAGAAGQAGVYFTRSTDGGKTFGSRLLVSNEAGSGTPSVALNGRTTIAVFPAFNGGTITATWNGTPANELTLSRNEQAAVPVAASAVIAFVREEAGTNTIWLHAPNG